MTVEKLLEAAARIRCLERAFSIRAGLTRDGDTLPKRFWEKVPDGPFKGEKLSPAKFEQMKTEYYAIRGWDPQTGVPTRETLEKLGLKDAVHDLEFVEKRTRKSKT